MLARQFLRMMESRDALLAAIRRHRDYRGDDRCHLDDGELYAALPEGDTRPLRDVAVSLENCKRFIRCRQQGIDYVSPELYIPELRDALVPFAEAAGRPGIFDDMSGKPLPDKAVLYMGIKVAAWKRAAEMIRRYVSIPWSGGAERGGERTL